MNRASRLHCIVAGAAAVLLLTACSNEQSNEPNIPDPPPVNWNLPL